MNLQANDINELRKHIGCYLSKLSYEIPRDAREFKRMEYINLFFLDVITTFYYNLKQTDRQRFIANIENISKALRKSYDSESLKGENND
jgi:hypothetical protein